MRIKIFHLLIMGCLSLQAVKADIYWEEPDLVIFNDGMQLLSNREPLAVIALFEESFFTERSPEYRFFAHIQQFLAFCMIEDFSAANKHLEKSAILFSEEIDSYEWMKIISPIMPDEFLDVFNRALERLPKISEQDLEQSGFFFREQMVCYREGFWSNFWKSCKRWVRIYWKDALNVIQEAIHQWNIYQEEEARHNKVMHNINNSQ